MMNQSGVDPWAEAQMFEEDVRAVVSMLRPHRNERLAGWTDYRTGNRHFRATVSWDEEFESRDQTPALIVPCMADVLETILVGSARNPDSLTAEQEFDLYRRVVHELIRRLDELQACHD